MATWIQSPNPAQAYPFQREHLPCCFLSGRGIYFLPASAYTQRQGYSRPIEINCEEVKMDLNPSADGPQPSEPNGSAVSEDRPARIKPKPPPGTSTPKSLSAMNLAMSPEDEDVAGHVDIILKEGSSSQQRREAAGKVGHAVNENIMLLRTAHILTSLEAGLSSKTPPTRGGALLLVSALCDICRSSTEPYLVPYVPQILNAAADKAADVHAAAVNAGRALINVMCPYGARFVLPHITAAMAPGLRWQQKYAACVQLRDLLSRAPESCADALPTFFPPLRDLMTDARDEVKEAALGAMQIALTLVNNRDFEPLQQDVISCILKPASVPDTIVKLAATTFAQPVESKMLSVMVPLLVRGLRERNNAIRRQTAVIITNMVRLVEKPAAVAPFMPVLLPEVDKVGKEISDPNARAVAVNTHALLVKAAGSEDGREALEAELAKRASPEMVAEHMKEELVEMREAGKSSTLFHEAVSYVATMCTTLMDRHCFDPAEWGTCFTPFLGPFVGGVAKQACEAVMRRCQHDVRVLEGVDDDVEEGEDLCDCDFSLAYGGRILLSGARLRLKRGGRYGLCGPNGCGKTTLMRAIAKGQVDGFPPPGEVLTVYVAHDIQAQHEDPLVLDYLADDAQIKGKGLDKARCQKALEDIGFDDGRLSLNISTLSGGWKMKLALARAMLLEAGLLLLDEPTNHMDTANVQWLQQYLLSCGTTLITVSHDSGFLDSVCTGIIHYENKKLAKYRGNLSAFVEQKPEAKAYYELTDEFVKFKFPIPGPLDGVKSREKPVIKCKKMTFQYEGAPKPQLKDVTLKANMAARVGVLGPNGAGKSTLIKVITGELKPTAGEIERHPNLRIAYIAQHAFHHLESHVMATPVQYIIRRYEHGEDEEEAEKVFRKMTDEEKKRVQTFEIDGMMRTVDEIKSRRKKKGDFQYEISWKGLPSIKYNKWFTREELVSRGFKKLIAEFDGKLASAAGDKKVLSRANVEEYLADFGLDEELASHSHIKGLSGGQKVKLVLAAAMWNHPHFLIMDEPTNYLDRDSLGALAGAIREFQGGVLLISHNSEFTSALCPEVWAVDNGVVDVQKPEGEKKAAGAKKG